MGEKGLGLTVGYRAAGTKPKARNPISNWNLRASSIFCRRGCRRREDREAELLLRRRNRPGSPTSGIGGDLHRGVSKDGAELPPDLTDGRKVDRLGNPRGLRSQGRREFEPRIGEIENRQPRSDRRIGQSRCCRMKHEGKPSIPSTCFGSVGKLESGRKLENESRKSSWFVSLIDPLSPYLRRSQFAKIGAVEFSNKPILRLLRNLSRISGAGQERLEIVNWDCGETR